MRERAVSVGAVMMTALRGAPGATTSESIGDIGKFATTTVGGGSARARRGISSL